MKHFILLALLVATATNIQRHKHGGTYRLHTKSGTEKNKLYAEYGTNFRYVGEVKNGLDRVTVVTSIPIPIYVDNDRKPLEFKNCSVENQSSNNVTTEMNEWCAEVVPFVEHLQKKKKGILWKDCMSFLCEDLYVALPELKPHVVTKSGQRFPQRPWCKFAFCSPRLDHPWQ